MKRRLLTCFLVAIMVMGVNAQANEIQENRIAVASPKLYFNGTTAVCEVSISQNGKKICATMELWQETNFVGSSSGEGNSFLILSETYAASKGKTYTLKVYGTIDGKPFTAENISKVC
ncbi:hypothetical protein [Oscillibacter sp.]|jgi:hypothetical protein|uniref:hypothetical protein n=1 Tax=Oscillibacter sp. TaxID=1945593 RepID=UPI00289EA432|nr:hypothetical protein [Oscillibacter sp.]